MSADDTREARTDAVRALEVQFSELINQFRRLITESANRVSPGLLPGAYKVFTTIVHRGAVTASALADVLMADKGQISRTVRELEDLGLIERTPDPADRRSSILSATPLGAERLAAARNPHEGSLMRTLADWPIEDIRNLTRLLHALAESGPRDDAEGRHPDPEA